MASDTQGSLDPLQQPTNNNSWGRFERGQRTVRNRVLTVATARSWSRAHRKIPMPMAGNKMCSLLAISGMPSRVTSPPSFGSRPLSSAPTNASDDPGVEWPASVPLPPPTAWAVPSASLDRSGRRSGLASVASVSCRPLSTAIFNAEEDHESMQLPCNDEEREGTSASTASSSPAISSSGLCARELAVAGRLRGRLRLYLRSVSSTGSSHCRHHCRAHTCRQTRTASKPCGPRQGCYCAGTAGWRSPEEPVALHI